MEKPVTIQLHKQAMLSGPALMLVPHWALEFDSVASGLVYQQLLFRSGFFTDPSLENPIARFSYTKLQRQFPFFTRRWIIEIIKRLETAGAIHVTRNGRVNVYSINKTFDCKVEATPQNTAAMLVFPALACKVGLQEAIALQQIHIRHHQYDGGLWAIRSFQQWQAEVFMFLGIATVKRLFARLQQQGLIFVKPYHGETTVNSYRVNYVRIAEVLDLPLPDVSKPTKSGLKDWTNPLYPIKPPASEAHSGAPILVVHQPISVIHQHGIS